MTIGKLERVPLREVWNHEALDFTRWLLDNPEIVADAVGIPLINLARECSVGPFWADIVGSDPDGNVVVIENQLEKSNHDHLGKLITYVSALDAKVAIWIVSDPRPEHVGAITWLNETNLCAFYLLKLETVRIGDSDAAPLLTLINGPSPETSRLGEAKKDAGERQGERTVFWAALLERSKSRTRLFATISPGRYGLLQTGSGMRGLVYQYLVWQHKSGLEFYIDRGTDREQDNLAIFEQLRAEKPAIEAAFCGELDFDPIDDSRACRIRRVFDGGYRSPKEDWPVIQDRMIDAMIRLEGAMRPRIDTLRS